MSMGTWNVRILYKTGTLEQLLPILEKYKIQVTAIQETRWLGKGVMDTKTHSILCSGKEDGAHEPEVAL